MFGGAEGIRTPDLLSWAEALHLSSNLADPRRKHALACGFTRSHVGWHLTATRVSRPVSGRFDSESADFPMTHGGFRAEGTRCSLLCSGCLTCVFAAPYCCQPVALSPDWQPPRAAGSDVPGARRRVPGESSADEHGDESARGQRRRDVAPHHRSKIVTRSVIRTGSLCGNHRPLQGLRQGSPIPRPLTDGQFSSFCARGRAVRRRRPGACQAPEASRWVHPSPLPDLRHQGQDQREGHRVPHDRCKRRRFASHVVLLPEVAASGYALSAHAAAAPLRHTTSGPAPSSPPPTSRPGPTAGPAAASAPSPRPSFSREARPTCGAGALKTGETPAAHWGLAVQVKLPR